MYLLDSRYNIDNTNKNDRDMLANNITNSYLQCSEIYGRWTLNKVVGSPNHHSPTIFCSLIFHGYRYTTNFMRSCWCLWLPQAPHGMIRLLIITALPNDNSVILCSSRNFKMHKILTYNKWARITIFDFSNEIVLINIAI